MKNKLRLRLLATLLSCALIAPSLSVGATNIDTEMGASVEVESILENATEELPEDTVDLDESVVGPDESLVGPDESLVGPDVSLVEPDVSIDEHEEATIEDDVYTIESEKVESEEATTEEITTNEECAVDSDYKTGYVIYINPQYADLQLISEADLKKSAAANLEDISRHQIMATYNTVEDAVKYVRSCMVARTTNVSFSCPGTDFNTLINRVLEETASPIEGDYLRANMYGYAAGWGYGGGSSYYNYSISFEYMDNAAQEKLVDAKVNTIIKNLDLKSTTKSEYDKVKDIHDYLVETISYLNDGTLTCHSTYAALCLGKCVCQGYASAFYRLCREASLSARYITGYAGGAHAWNIVKVEGQYYNMDVTFDDPVGGTRIYYSYFLKNAEDFNDHIRDDEYNTADFKARYPIAFFSYGEGGMDVENIYREYTGIDEEIQNTEANGRPKFIMYYNLKDDSIGTVTSMMKDFAGSNWCKNRRADIILVDTGKASKEEIMAFAEANDPNGYYKFTYGSTNAAFDDFWTYREMSNKSLAGYYPILVMIDEHNKLQFIRGGKVSASDINAGYMYYLKDNWDPAANAKSIEVRMFADDEAVASNKYTAISALNFKYGETVILKGVALPTKSKIVDFDSSTMVELIDSEGVVSYDEETGSIEALKLGTAKIKYTSVYTPSLSRTINITVKPAPIVSISLNKSSLMLTLDESEQLEVRFNPEITTDDKSIIWTSSNEAVATVDEDGIVTATGSGSASIFAYTTTGKKAECKVIVYQSVETVSVIDSEGNELSELELMEGESRLLKGVWGPTGAISAAGVDWNVTDKGIVGLEPDATGCNAVITGLSQGSTTVTLDVDGISQTVLITVTEAGISEILVPGVVEYTGAQLKPAVKVYSGSTELTPGKDYTVSYKNNTKAFMLNEGEDGFLNKKGVVMAPTVIVKGKGNYSGTYTTYFKIKPKALQAVDITVDELALSKKYNGKVQLLSPTVKWNKITLKKNTDYDLVYTDTSEGAYKNPGQYSVLLTGKGNYCGMKLATIRIIRNDLVPVTKCKFKGITNMPWTGELIKQKDLTVTYGGTVLTEGREYRLQYHNNKEIGTATVDIIGIGVYTGTKTLSFKITGANINKALVIDGLGAVSFTGKENRPKLVVKYKQANGITTTLTENEDYRLEYNENTIINAGTGKLVIRGINGYYGTLSKSFTINKQDIRGTQFNIGYGTATEKYVKGGVKPKVTISVKLGDELVNLVENKDYTVTYKNNKAVNMGDKPSSLPTIVIKGKGNYTGQVNKVFLVMQQSIAADGISMSAVNVLYKNKAGNYKSKITVTDVDGAALTANRDYNLKNAIISVDSVENVAEEYLADESFVTSEGAVLGTKDKVAPGTRIKLTVNGIGYYKDSVSAFYYVSANDISKLKFTIDSKTYTGEVIEPDLDEITITDAEGNTVDSSEFVITGYGKNTNKGKGSVTIKGVKNYSGIKQISFNIVPSTVSGMEW